MSGPAASAVSGRRRRGLQWQADDQAHQSISIQAGHRGNDWLIVFCDKKFQELHKALCSLVH